MRLLGPGQQPVALQRALERQLQGGAGEQVVAVEFVVGAVEGGSGDAVQLRQVVGQAPGFAGLEAGEGEAQVRQVTDEGGLVPVRHQGVEPVGQVIHPQDQLRCGLQQPVQVAHRAFAVGAAAEAPLQGVGQLLLAAAPVDETQRVERPGDAGGGHCLQAVERLVERCRLQGQAGLAAAQVEELAQAEQGVGGGAFAFGFTGGEAG